ncbi:hypothetical protein [Haloarcula onubensis]|uniref:Uncharacterized protein n=1 Tax=Haloarcula onubensis TaxID=2950539 RepID=A0ABU2FUH8_9EURY|nr:hypothetical protein [Halomicroarcula sp. S3CR25-11]MDS0284423.1 hypothetical protein [Halomicroarcula sp. S3CR25-11]
MELFKVTDRERQIRELVADIRTHETVDDAFLAKSFTDRLLILDINGTDGIPEEIVARLRERDFYSAETVYDKSGNHTSDFGDVERVIESIS